MTDSSPARGPLDRLAAFRVVYAGILVYVVLSVATIEMAEGLLSRHYAKAVERAASVSPMDGPIVQMVQRRVRAATDGSFWVRVGGVRVTALVLGADGRTPIFLEGTTIPPPSETSLMERFDEAERLLPAITTTQVAVPLDSLLSGTILVVYGGVLVGLLFVHNASLARREEEAFEAAIAAREATLERARSIQSELEKVRGRLAKLEPAERAASDEIEALRRERAALQAKLEELSSRESQLSSRGDPSGRLEDERRALEDLLDEAVQDLDAKEREIAELQGKLKKAAKGGGGKGGKAFDALAKRMRTLYHNLEIDDRAIDDIVALGDESLRLRAEEALKKLDDGPEGAQVRRKVGGLPGHQAIFELGFAGKGRIYYAKGQSRPFRILAVGGKASQKSDLEYLSRVQL